MKGHSNILGNDLADQAADRGRRTLLPAGGTHRMPGISAIDMQQLVDTLPPDAPAGRLAPLQIVIAGAAEAVFAVARVA